MDATGKGNKIIFIFASPVDGNSLKTMTDQYDEQTKQDCLTAYVNGMGFRAIERLKEAHHTTIIHCQ